MPDTGTLLWQDRRARQAGLGTSTSDRRRVGRRASSPAFPAVPVLTSVSATRALARLAAPPSKWRQPGSRAQATNAPEHRPRNYGAKCFLLKNIVLTRHPFMKPSWSVLVGYG